MTDLIELVARAQNELPYRFAAFEALVRSQLGGVRRLARGMVRDADAADSIAQDVMLRMLHGLPALADAGRFPAWLQRITVNVCRTHLAREAREADKRRNLMQETAGDEPTTGIVAPPALAEASFDMLLQPLTVEERTIICLKLLQEMEFGAIAEVTGLGLSAVKMRYYRALEKVEANLQSDG